MRKIRERREGLLEWSRRGRRMPRGKWRRMTQGATRFWPSGDARGKQGKVADKSERLNTGKYNQKCNENVFRIGSER